MALSLSNQPPVEAPAKADSLLRKTRAVQAQSQALPTVASETTVQTLARDTLVSSSSRMLKAGVTGVPIDAIFNIPDYHAGRLNAQEYVGKTLNGFFTWTAFEAGLIGSTALATRIAGAPLKPLPAMIVGVGSGIIAAGLYDQTLGGSVSQTLGAVMPRAAAEKVARSVDAVIGKPLQKGLIDPVKQHPALATAAGLTLAAALSLKYPVGFGQNVLIGMGGATVVGLAGNLGTAALIHQLKPATPAAPVSQAELDWALKLEKTFQAEKNLPAASQTIRQADIDKYEAILVRVQKQQTTAAPSKSVQEAGKSTR